jgi:uncharacterized protein (TIRG00374 family)
MKKTHIVAQFALGIIILLAVILYFGGADYVQVFSNVSIFWFAMACIPAFVIQAITAFQQYYICKTTGIPFKFKDSLFISNWGGLIGFFNAGLDFLYTLESVKNYGSTDRTTALNRLGFMYSVGTVVTVLGVFLGVFYFGNYLSTSFVYYPLMALSIVMLVCAIGFLAFLIGPQWVMNIKHRLFKVAILNKVFGKLLSDDLVTKRKEAVVLFCSSLLNWVVKALEWVFLSYAVGAPLPFWFCFSIFFIVDLSRQVPFVPTNFGVNDIVTALGLSTAGMSVAAGLVFAMLNRLDNVVSNSFAIISPSHLTSVFSKLNANTDEIPSIPKEYKTQQLNDEKFTLNLGCGEQKIGNIRVDMMPTSATTHVFNIDEGIKFPNSTFDVVYERNYLEHSKNVGKHLSEIYRVLKEGGIADITTDNASCFRYYLFGTHTGRYEKLHNTPESIKEHGKDCHYSIFTKQHLLNHFEAAGFKVIGIDYIKTDTLGRFIDLVTFQHPRIRVIARREKIV